MRVLLKILIGVFTIAAFFSLFVSTFYILGWAYESLVGCEYQCGTYVDTGAGVVAVAFFLGLLSAGAYSIGTALMGED